MTHADRSLAGLLDDLAAATPAPGGGAAAAWTAALAGSLVEMAAEFASGPREPADREPPDRERAFQAVAARARELRTLALELADQDTEAYGPVLEAVRLDREHPERERRIRVASSAAAGPPIAIARIGAELAELGAELARRGNPNLTGDALTGTLLAEAACAAAARLVAINLAGDEADPRLAESAALTRSAFGARSRALA